jgi:hypothetical protein
MEFSTGDHFFTIPGIDEYAALRHAHLGPRSREGISAGRHEMNRKAYLKDPYFATPPTPFSGLDYVLCAIAFFLVGIAAVPALTALLIAPGK